MDARRSQVLRTKGPIGDMLPANSPPTNGKASHKRKAPAEIGSPAQPAAGQPRGKAEPAASADAPAEEHAPAKKQAAAKRPGVARKAPAKSAKVSKSEQTPAQMREQPGNATHATTDASLQAGAASKVPVTDADPAQSSVDALALPNGHVSHAADPDAAPPAAAMGPGEGVPPVADAELPCKKKGGWPKGKPRRNHVPTGKVRSPEPRPLTLLSRLQCLTSSHVPMSLGGSLALGEAPIPTASAGATSRVQRRSAPASQSCVCDVTQRARAKANALLADRRHGGAAARKGEQQQQRPRPGQHPDSEVHTPFSLSSTYFYQCTNKHPTFLLVTVLVEKLLFV